MHKMSMPQNGLAPKRSMADIRQEKIDLSNKQKKEAELSQKARPEKVCIWRPWPARKDGEIHQTMPIVEEFEVLRRPSNHRPFKTDPAKCYCNRPQTDVWCLMCGYITKGNVKMTCPQHPNSVNIREMVVCPNPKCRAPNHLNEVDKKMN